MMHKSNFADDNLEEEVEWGVHLKIFISSGLTERLTFRFANIFVVTKRSAFLESYLLIILVITLLVICFLSYSFSSHVLKRYIHFPALVHGEKIPMFNSMINMCHDLWQMFYSSKDWISGQKLGKLKNWLAYDK